MPHPAGAIVAAAAALATLTSCSAGSPSSAPPNGATEAGRPTATPDSEAGGAPSGSTDAGPASGGGPGRSASGHAVAHDAPRAGATARAQPPAGRRTVDHDPLTVAASYLRTRLTYRYDDVAGYRAAQTAPAYTTAALAARSQPSTAALSRLATAQETSAVHVGRTEFEDEAPRSATTAYVRVELTTVTTYRGDGTGQPEPAVWTLRLLRKPAGRWRVDAVLSTR